MTIHLQPDYKTFELNFKEGKTQLLHYELPGDLETPVGAYLKLSAGSDHSFLLESVEGGNVLGRYSILGFNPDKVWRCKYKNVETSTDGKIWTKDNSNALTSLRSHINACHIDICPDHLPPMAVSGLFGYLGYDMVRLIENIADENPDDLNIPDSVLIRPTILAIFDNVKQVLHIVTPVYETNGSAKNVYEQASTRLKEALNLLQDPIPQETLTQSTNLSAQLSIASNLTKTQYKNAVQKAVEYIYEGEIFQVVPSQRFTSDFDLPSTALYRSLRRLNPSPFMFHLDLKDFQIIGASPEVLVRVREGEVTIRPIAGTRPRGANASEDNALAEELLSDEKERSEHLMLLDLGRNDVGRVSEFGTVQVTDSFIIERYSHVMHIVSNVVGKLKKNLDIVDALFAGFPAGTVSGAPKVRAMEIIEELETTRRGFYAGAVGYFSGNGTLDTCIALRTALLKDGKLYVQAGGGVVADSDPEFEFQETVNKSKALFKAAENAIKSHQ